MRCPIWFVALLVLFSGSTAYAQLRDIDVEHLPLTVVAAYHEVLPYNELLRNYSNKWTDPTPKKNVVRKFKNALDTLMRAQKADPDNVELDLLTGLTAHLAYNLDVESAYEGGAQMFAAAAKAAPHDPRPDWFYGIHECETAHPEPGMERLLRVEVAHPQLPGDFWRDYGLCAQIVNMPAHAARAYALAKKQGVSERMDDVLAQAAAKSLRPADTEKQYPVDEAWTAAKVGPQVRFTSFLCGLAFSTAAEAEVAPHDVNNGSCAVTVVPPGYLHEVKFHTPTLLVLSNVTGRDESLEAYVEKTSHMQTEHAQRVTLPCPVDNCLGFELRKPDMYASAGGAHLLLIAFRTEAPAYPGLALETPQGPPVPEDGKMQYYTRKDAPRRFAGTVQTVVLMDASEAIYAHARSDFEALVRSMTVDR